MANKEINILLVAKDLASGNINKVKGELGGLSRSGRLAAVGLGGAMRATTGLSGALSHAKGVLSGGLGLVGLGVGAAGVSRLLHDSVGNAEAFGRASVDLQKVIGGTISDVSVLVDTLDKFGLSGEDQIRVLGLMERNVGKIGATTKSAAAFQKQYGFSVLDSKGKIADANELIKRSADYFNSNATASDKATVLAKLYGKQWQAMIPILSKGRAGINKEEATALRLNADQIKQLAALRGAQRELNDTWGDTKTLIGIALVPQITKLARALNAFVGSHQQEIVSFFKGAAQFAEEMGSSIARFVIPGIKAIGTAWSAIPSEVRQMLLGGFVANKAIKIVFGFDPIRIVEGGIGSALKGALSGLFSRGGSPVTPMWVRQVGPAGPAGPSLPGVAAPTAAAAAGGLSAAAGLVGGSLFLAQGIMHVVQANELLDKTNQELGTNLSFIDAVGRGIDTILGRQSAAVRDTAETRATLTRAKDAIVSALVAGFGNVVAAVDGLPGFLGSAAAQGRGTGSEGRRRVASTPRVGIEKNRGHADGVLAMTKGITDLGFAGEAGREGVVVAKNPKAISKTSGLPVHVTNWPSSSGFNGSGGDGSAASFNVLRLNRHSPAHDAVLANVRVSVAPRMSARESHKGSKQWRRYGNGKPVSID